MSGPELPVIYENPRFDKATPTLWPVFDRATRFTLVILIEWGTLTLIEDSPRYVKFATVIVAVLGLAVHESWPWLRMRDWRWYPSLMVTLIVGYLALFFYALYAEPQKAHGNTGAETVTQPGSSSPAKRRSPKVIDELMQESAALLDLIKKVGLPAIQEWQAIAFANPEHSCIGQVDLSDISTKAMDLAKRLREAQASQLAIFEKSGGLDNAELVPLLYEGNPIPPMPTWVKEFENAAIALDGYGVWVRTIGSNLTCENLIKSQNVPAALIGLDRAFQRFIHWVGWAQESLAGFQRNLHIEARNSP